ncbi:hypothetical protein ES703_18518 [subsurface metagenome]
MLTPITVMAHDTTGRVELLKTRHEHPLFVSNLLDAYYLSSPSKLLHGSRSSVNSELGHGDFANIEVAP